MNYLITYSFDFKNEELLSYYISFLRFVFLFFFSPSVVVISGYLISLQYLFDKCFFFLQYLFAMLFDCMCYDL